MDMHNTAQHAAHGAVHGLVSDRTVAQRVVSALRAAGCAGWRCEDWAGGFFNATRELPGGRSQYIAVADEDGVVACWAVAIFDDGGGLVAAEVLGRSAVLADALEVADRMAGRDRMDEVRRTVVDATAPDEG